MALVSIVVVLVIILLAANIRIVPQAHSFIVERLGAYKETWDVGLHIKVPFIDRQDRLTLRSSIATSRLSPLSLRIT